MKKNLKIMLSLGCLSMLVAGAVACNKPSAFEEYRNKGYKISVTYDANGGSFLNRPGVTIVDMFNPSDYTPNSAGKVEISLLEPTDPSRPGSEVTLTLPNYFFAGWYGTRTLQTNADGNPIDWYGKELEEKEGAYYYVGTETKATPAYDYSDYWDFEKDVIEYAEEDGIVDKTLYAGWVPFYEFNYYYRVEGETKWTLSDKKTVFDYKTTQAQGTNKNTIWTPAWSDGAMNHVYEYSNGDKFEFPKVAGTTFAKAYLDEDAQEAIVESCVHKGVLDPDYGDDGKLLVKDRVQNVYVELEKGEKYRIETAEQFIKHANKDGLYEIYNDLDFSTVESKWSPVFSNNTFNGTIVGKDGKKVTFKNVTVAYSGTAKAGGMFGEIGDTAKIENVAFENVTVDFVSIGAKNNDANFGTLAGTISAKATLTGVSISGTMKIGALSKADGLAFHLVANGNISGVTVGEMHLQMYGTKVAENKYRYTVDPDKVTVNAKGEISLSFFPSQKFLEKEIYNIQ